jgi:hypothetical protein
MGKFLGCIFIFLIVMGMGILLAIQPVSYYGYKNGQIDALNGVIKYELTVNAANETVWEKIKEK